MLQMRVVGLASSRSGQAMIANCPRCHQLWYRGQAFIPWFDYGTNAWVWTGVCDDCIAPGDTGRTVYDKYLSGNVADMFNDMGPSERWVP